jgi:hypothetical protein
MSRVSCNYFVRRRIGAIKGTILTSEGVLDSIQNTFSINALCRRLW